MKRLFVALCTLISLASCGGTGMSFEEIAAQEAAYGADEAANKAEYNRNAAQASTLLQSCDTIHAVLDTPTLMRYVKETLDVACRSNLAQMEIISQKWDLAITREVYMKDTNASIELAKHKLKSIERGTNLIGAAANECLTKGMQQIGNTGGQSMESFHELLDYYVVYTQIYDLVADPKGSLVSYRQAISDLRLETTIMSSRLNIILQ